MNIIKVGLNSIGNKQKEQIVAYIQQYVSKAMDSSFHPKKHKPHNT